MKLLIITGVILLLFLNGLIWFAASWILDFGGGRHD